MMFGPRKRRARPPPKAAAAPSASEEDNGPSGALIEVDSATEILHPEFEPFDDEVEPAKRKPQLKKGWTAGGAGEYIVPCAPKAKNLNGTVRITSPRGVIWNVEELSLTLHALVWVPNRGAWESTALAPPAAATFDLALSETKCLQVNGKRTLNWTLPRRFLQSAPTHIAPSFLVTYHLHLRFEAGAQATRAIEVALPLCVQPGVPTPAGRGSDRHTMAISCAGGGAEAEGAHALTGSLSALGSEHDIWTLGEALPAVLALDANEGDGAAALGKITACIEQQEAAAVAVSSAASKAGSSSSSSSSSSAAASSASSSSSSSSSSSGAAASSRAMRRANTAARFCEATVWKHAAASSAPADQTHFTLELPDEAAAQSATPLSPSFASETSADGTFAACRHYLLVSLHPRNGGAPHDVRLPVRLGRASLPGAKRGTLDGMRAGRVDEDYTKAYKEMGMAVLQVGAMMIVWWRFQLFLAWLVGVDSVWEVYRLALRGFKP